MGLLDEAIREHLELKRRRGADPAEIAREEKEALSPPTRASAPQGAPTREGHGEDAGAGLDEPATAFAPGAAPEEREEPPAREKHLRPVEEPESREKHLRPVEEPPAPAPRMRVTEEDLGARRAEPAPPAEPPSPPPPDDVPAAADEPLAPGPAPADLDSNADARFDDEPDTDDFVFEEDDLFAHEDLDEGELDDPTAPEPVEEAQQRPPLDQPTQQYALEDLEDATGHGAPPGVPASGEGGEDDEPEGEELLEETPEFLEETPEHDRLWFEQKPPRDFDF